MRWHADEFERARTRGRWKSCGKCGVPFGTFRNGDVRIDGDGSLSSRQMASRAPCLPSVDVRFAS